MKKTLIVFVFTLILSSCYSYVAFEPENIESLNNNSNENTNLVGNKLKNVRNTNVQVLNEEDISNTKNKEKPKTSTVELDLSKVKITDIIKINQFYKIDVNNKYYKIEAKQWKADTLYAIKKGTKEELKFHKDEIKDVKIRKFSKGKSDALTVAAYALGGIGIFLLLK
ncbi:hypothetical protein [Chishuiella sp.]|uniref:hypothetical protein n=1 Tax=Chishuiella sp. TaxID=1969467 RepID=UPI0028B0C2BA|nr:hypothetical protein [Chishuiella sp.]